MALSQKETDDQTKSNYLEKRPSVVVYDTKTKRAQTLGSDQGYAPIIAESRPMGPAMETILPHPDQAQKGPAGSTFKWRDGELVGGVRSSDQAQPPDQLSTLWPT